MSIGQGNISFTEPVPAGGGGGIVVNGAHNGLSVDIGSFIVLGQDVGEAGDPAALLNSRQVPLEGFFLEFTVPAPRTNLFAIDSGAVAMLNYFKGLNGQQPAELITIQGQAPAGNPFGNYWVTLDESLINSDGQRDAVLEWGYNQTGSGGRVVANEAAVWWGIDSHLLVGGTPEFDVTLQSIAKSGVVTKHFSLVVDKNTGVAIGVWIAQGWQWKDAAGLSYWSIDEGGNGALSGNGTNLRLINTNPAFGQLSVSTEPDGSVNVGNGTSGSNNVVNFANSLVVNNTNPANPVVLANVPNDDNIVAYMVGGTVSAGAGNVFAFRSEVNAAGELIVFNENVGIGDSIIVARAAVGSGNAFAQFSNGSGAKSFAMGLSQVSGNFIMTNGTGIAIGSNLMTMTPQAQAGFGGNVAPSAFVHLAASAGAAGLGPLKLTAGTNTAVVEAGLMEYDGTNLFFTPSATRQSIFMATDGGAAPTTSVIVLPTTIFGGSAALLGAPGHWASVVVGGVTYKIPLYS